MEKGLPSICWLLRVTWSLWVPRFAAVIDTLYWVGDTLVTDVLDSQVGVASETSSSLAVILSCSK